MKRINFSHLLHNSSLFIVLVLVLVGFNSKATNVCGQIYTNTNGSLKVVHILLRAMF